MTLQAEELAIDQLNVKDLKEHPDNPRKHFNTHALEEMAASIRQVGVLVPLLVRKQGSYWQILAGARRFRAANLAGLETVPAIIRDLDDAAALELMVLDNLQRQDLHPLEEAAGYQQLMRVAKYDVARVAARVGRSVKYVYDRVKLLELVPEAKKIFREGVITAGHAILLARLKPEDQKRAITTERSRQEALFEEDASQAYDVDAKNPYQGLKTRSVRELQAWIDDHVRFDHTKPPDPMLFPVTAETMAGVQKIVPITHEHYIPEDARDKSRTYGPRSWKRADGIGTQYDYRTGRTVKSKSCDKSQLGVVVVGEGRGDAFQVCISKTCEIHFPQQAGKEKRRGAPAAATQSRESAEDKALREALDQARDEARDRVEALIVAAAGKASPATVMRALLADWQVRDYLTREKISGSPAAWRKKATPAELQRALVSAHLSDMGPGEDLVEAFGIDVKKVFKEAETRARAALQAAKAQTSAPAKGKATRKGGRQK